MTVGELKRNLQCYNDNVEVILASDCIHGTSINQDFYGEYVPDIYVGKMESEE